MDGKPAIVGVCGAPGVGKTTLAKAVRRRLAAEGREPEDLPEVARLITAKGVKIDKEMGEADYDAFLQAYAERDAAPRGLAVADRTPVDHYSYVEVNGNTSENVRQRHRQAAVDGIRRYNVLLYLPIQFPLRRDGFRTTDPGYQRRLDTSIRTLLTQVDVPVVRLDGSRNERIRGALDAIHRYCPQYFSSATAG